LLAVIAATLACVRYFENARYGTEILPQYAANYSMAVLSCHYQSTDGAIIKLIFTPSEKSVSNNSRIHNRRIH